VAYTFIPMSGKMEFNHQYNIACLYLSFNLIKKFQVTRSKYSKNVPICKRNIAPFCSLFNLLI
ncbi:MAG: hypothetical protein LW599_02970, partial [Rickettsiaceae bacterium]|nr:hypothetical protein [Rickettsiaceae bacterium]